MRTPAQRKANAAFIVSGFLPPFSLEYPGWTKPPLGVAENEARLCDRTKPDRAKWWRQLPDVPEAKLLRCYDQWWSNAQEPIKVLLACAEKHERASVELLMLLTELLNGFYALAANGNKTAARLWMEALTKSIVNFEMLATHEPALFIEEARKSYAIPGMISRNAEKMEDNQRHLKQLQQGEDCPFDILPKGGRTKRFFEGVNFLAGGLYNHIAHAIENLPFVKVIAESEGIALPAWVNEAKNLKPLSRDTWKTWAEVAWSVVMEATNGRPEENPSLANLGASAARRAPKFCKELRPKTKASRTHHKVKERLFTAFAGLAGVFPAK